MKEPILYPYADDENGKATHISEVNPTTRNEHRYHCHICNSEMIPKLGPKNKPHFAHKGDDNTIYHKESYIHHYAKETIVKRLKSGSFPIRRKGETICSHYENCKESENRKEYKEERCRENVINLDLSKIYDLEPEVEKNLSVKEEIFRPDVTFFSSNVNFKPICIEIYHTNSCSDLKLELCPNVIEIPVKKEEDLTKLITAIFSEIEDEKNDPNTYPVSFINFDSPVFVSRCEFDMNYPPCLWTDEEKRTRWLKLIGRWDKTGSEILYKPIVEKEKFTHEKGFYFEFSMEYNGDRKTAEKELRNRAVETFSKCRSCQDCIKENTSKCTGLHKADECESFRLKLIDVHAMFLWSIGFFNYIMPYPPRKSKK